MARTAEKVQSLIDEDDAMRPALAAVLEAAENGGGPVEWGDVSDDLTSGQWGRIIQTGILEDEDGGFVVTDPGDLRTALSDAGANVAAPAPTTETEADTATGTDTSSSEDDEDSGWTTWDKLAAVGSLGLFAGYSIGQVRAAVGGTIDVVLGPLLDIGLPFEVVVLVVALLTGLYSTLLQANLMDMDKISERQEEMQDIRKRRKEAKERGDDEALEQIQKEQMEAMDLSMFTAQFRPMVWIMLLTIPLFLWMYWIIRDAGMGSQTIVLPLAGETQWNQGVLGPIRAWIVWYFLCSMGFSQLIRKSLDLQTTPT